MNTLQIQKPGNDQSQNSADVYAYAGNVYIDWKVTAVIVLSLLVVWGVALLATSMQCAATYAITCVSFSIVLYAPLLILAIGLTGLTLAGVWYALNGARKNALANARWQHFDVADARAIYAQTLAVALQDAKSSATSQMDTFNYSPSNTTSKPIPESAAAKDPLKGAAIGIEDMFKFKED